MTEIEEFFDLFFYRPLAFVLVKIIYPTNITPNQLTLTAIIAGLAAGCIYATGWPQAGLYGALLYMAYNIIDCSDGQLARLKKNGTHAGRIIDGIADYISAAAVFIGLGIGRPDHRYSRGWWWLLLAAAAVSNIIQSILVDYYRNRFLDYVLQRKSTFEEDMHSFRQEYNAIRYQKNRWFDKWVIKTYFSYFALQEKLIAQRKNEKLFVATPQDYYKKNRLIIRGWVIIGPTMQITLLMICSAICRFDVYFSLTVGLFNIIAAIVWLLQKNIDQTFRNT